jgi:acetyl esterase
MRPLLFRHLPALVHRVSTYPGLRFDADIPYADRPGCRLDLLRPPGAAGPLPVVVHIHGGAFRALSKETHGHAAARYARAGFAVVNVEYRLAPGAPYPAAVRDVHDALRFVAERASDLDLDLDRIVLAGESAGANLALGLALSCGLPRPEPWAQRVRALGLAPRALHLAYGFLQVTDPARYGRDIATPPLVRWRLPQIVADYLPERREPAEPSYADPLRILEALPDRSQLGDAAPAVLALCGGRDPIADDTRRLIAASRRLGLPTAEAWFPSSGHGFHLLFGRDARAAWRAALSHAAATAR